MCELDALKIYYSKDITFKINTRAVSRLGLCKKIGKSYIIEISAALLDERADIKNGLKNTILHELLHTCRGCMKHTGKWKELADRVNAAYGYKIRRAASPAERMIPQELVPPAKYLIKCTKCGVEIARRKRSSLVEHPQNYRCGKCGGTLTRVK